jgi:hypothetical protein
VSPLYRAKVLPRSRKVRSQTRELFEVKRGQDFEPFGAFLGEMQSDDPVIVLVASPLHQACSSTTARSMRPTALMWRSRR